MTIEIQVPDFWADHTIEYFADSLHMLGVDVDPQKDVRYSGFWNQGDGASFKGIVAFSNCNIGQFIQCYPKDEAMLELANRWEKVASQLQEVELRTVYNCSHYCHENTMIDDAWYAGDDQGPKLDELRGEVMSILRGFARQLYKQLEDEYEYLLAYETANLYDELASDSRTLIGQIRDLESVPEVPALLAVHLEELQANRQELLEVMTAQMNQLQDQFSYWKDGRPMSIHEFLVYVNQDFS